MRFFRAAAWLYPESELRRKTQWMVLWRLVLTAVILLLTSILQGKSKERLPFPLTPVYGLVILQFSCSLLYILGLMALKGVKTLAMAQLAVDGLAVSGLILFTGGVESLWIYLYFFIVGAAGLLFYRPGGLAAAAGLGLLYGLTLLAQSRDWLPAGGGWEVVPSHYPWGYSVYHWGLAMTGFFFVGFLGSWLPEQFSRQRRQLAQQQQDIDQLEEFNRLIIDNLDMGLITLNARQEILTINPAGRKVLGLEAALLPGLPVTQVLPQLAALPGWPDLAQGQRFEVSYQTPQGAGLTLGFSVTHPTGSAAAGMEQIVTFKNLTHIREMEDHLRQMDRLAMMGQMAAGFVHEVKNPLASISGSIQMLREELREDGPGERLLSLISREVDKLDILLHDFLTFARPSPQAERLVDLGDLIPGTVELVRKNKGVPQTIRWDLNLEPNLLLQIPPSEFSQILWNLLTNAVQAVSEQGGIAILGRRLTEGKYAGGLEIRVRDDGAGIPEGNQEKVFTPFFTTKEKGVGLGLSIVQKIIAQNGGLIRLQNRPEGGTEVLLVFPDPEKRGLTGVAQAG